MRMRARRQAELYDGFRVDHLVGFYRTYVRPLDKRPAYFVPEHEWEQIQLGESLMRIMIDSGADVSVEDLGTVPPFVRESIARLGLPGYKVLRWEPLDPVWYPATSVAMTGTHDTEPLAVWWETLPAAERARFAVDASFNAEVRDRILDRMLNAGSNLVLLPMQDIFGWRDRINTPATTGDANWTYVLPWPIDRMAHEGEARERAGRLAEWTRSAGRWSDARETD
jgi:4-alpha-glucanotransferase